MKLNLEMENASDFRSWPYSLLILNLRPYYPAITFTLIVIGNAVWNFKQ